MMFDDEKDHIAEILKGYTDKSDVEIFEINILERGRTRIIDIAADKQNGGITIDECACINVYLNRMLEESGIFGYYTIQVSSPGVDRPLKTKRDFLRAMDKEIQVYLLEPHEGKMQYDGVLIGAKDDGIILNVKQNSVTIPFEKINKGLQVF